MNIQEFKTHFYSGHEYLHFNNSGQGLLPTVYRDAVISWMHRFYEQGVIAGLDAWTQVEECRNQFASFCNADPNEVAFFQTTASALSQAASSVQLNPGDEILTWDQEYPSNFYPWRRLAEKNGAHVIQVQSENWQTPYQSLLHRVTPKTKVIAVSWVQYHTGSMTDLKALSTATKNSGIFLVADIIQGVGVRQFDFKDCGFDIVCGGSHKWLCSGYGAGFMIAKKDRLSQMEPLELGAGTYGTPDTEKSFAILPKTNASRFEPGTKSIVEIAAMKETLELFSSVGMNSIFNEACRLADLLRLGLMDLKMIVHSMEGPIVTFTCEDNNKLNAIAFSLKEAKVSFAQRSSGIRLSTHAYNTDAQIHRVLQIIATAKA